MTTSSPIILPAMYQFYFKKMSAESLKEDLPVASNSVASLNTSIMGQSKRPEGLIFGGFLDMDSQDPYDPDIAQEYVQALSQQENKAFELGDPFEFMTFANWSNGWFLPDFCASLVPAGDHFLYWHSQKEFVFRTWPGRQFAGQYKLFITYRE